MNGELRFDRVTLRRGGRLLFKEFNLVLRPGEALQLVGPNGSGKSSLIRVAAGLLAIISGRVDRSRSALADERVGFDQELPLRRALAFWVGSPDAALDALGLSALSDVPVRFLSTGQMKRAALARVAASNAPLWLLDEPLNGLDDRGATLLDGVVADHLASGGAVLAASHQPLGGKWLRLELPA